MLTFSNLGGDALFKTPPFSRPFVTLHNIHIRLDVDVIVHHLTIWKQNFYDMNKKNHIAYRHMPLRRVWLGVVPNLGKELESFLGQWLFIFGTNFVSWLLANQGKFQGNIINNYVSLSLCIGLLTYTMICPLKVTVSK